MPSTRTRSFVKGLVWELTAPIILFIFTQEVKIILGYTATRIVMYYVYERIWKRIRWGKYKESTEYQSVDLDSSTTLKK